LIKVKIETPEGELIEQIDFPQLLREVKLSQFTAYEAKWREREEWIKEWQDKDISGPKFMLTYIEWTVKLLSAFLDTDAGKYPLGDWMEHIKKISQGKEFDYSGVEGNVLNLLANVYRLIAQYNLEVDYSQDYEFTHKGEKFFVKSAYRDAVTGRDVFDGIEAARVLEALKMFDVWQKNRSTDENGNFFFTSLLFAIACFAQKEGETFPTMQSQITNHVNRRVEFFLDIDAETGLDIASFFLRTSNLLEGIKLKNTFGNLLDGLEKASKKLRHLQNRKLQTSE